MPRPTFPPIAVSSWGWRRASQQIHGGRRLLATEATAVTAPSATRDEAIHVPVEKLGAMRVTVLDNSAAAEYATRICDLPPSKKDLVFMSDASCVNEYTGAYAWAVVYKDPKSPQALGPEWKRVTGVVNGATTTSAEFWALLRAQEEAEKLIVSLSGSVNNIKDKNGKKTQRNKRLVVNSVKFFGDSRTAILRSAILCAAAFRDGSESRVVVSGQGMPASRSKRTHSELDLERFVGTNHRLRQLVPVMEMHWTPREGNREADLAARAARDKERARTGVDHQFLDRQPWTTLVLDKGMRQVLRLAGGILLGTAMLWAKFC